MYFAIAYDLWPHLTGRALTCLRLMRVQLWTWFIGMIVLTFPWHYVGILGMPRRMAFYDYSNPAHRSPRPSPSIASVLGGFILVVSGRLLPRRAHPVAIAQPRTEPGAYRFSVAAHQPRTMPAALNGLGLWVSLMLALTVINYGYPIMHLLATPNTNGARGPGLEPQR